VACLSLRLTPAEALVGATINAAHALGIGESAGSLEPDKQADLVVWRASSVDEIPYWPAANLVQTVIKRGRVVLQRN
jgi:imidazolonepropionase